MTIKDKEGKYSYFCPNSYDENIMMKFVKYFYTLWAQSIQIPFSDDSLYLI